LALSNSPLSLLKLTTETVAAADPGAPATAAGLLALHQPGVSVALRSALHMVGDTTTPLSSQHKHELAGRFLQQRIVVDEHTAAAVLLESFSLCRVAILREFPGAVPPAYDCVGKLLRNPPSREHCGYSFNHHGSRVHYVFSTLIDDSPASCAARAWWRGVNLLPDTGAQHDLSSGTQFNFISRRAKSSLHLDTADGTNTQWRGEKLWVMVDKEEAKQRGIVELLSDAMRENPAGTHRMSAWLACQSFQWFVAHEGDTVVLPRDKLHAVSCIGDGDAVSAGIYCWLLGTPDLPHGYLQPVRPRKRKQPPAAAPSSPPSAAPLSIVQHAAAAAPSHHSSPCSESLLPH
jgi:hypothetical protein